MKKLAQLGAILAVFALPSVAVESSMDPLKVAPDMYRLSFENEKVRVMEVTFQPGQEIPKHSHPDHYAYVLTPGKLQITKADGTSSDADLKIGQVMWIPAETHSAKNTGVTPVRLLVSELKDSKGAMTQTGATAPQKTKK